MSNIDRLIFETDGFDFSKEKEIKLSQWSLGLYRPIGQSDFVWECRFTLSSFSSDISHQWYEYKDRPYEKRIGVYHDINFYNLALGASWRPCLANSRWYFDVSLLPSLQWYHIPGDRNISDDSRWAVQQDFLSEPDKKVTIAWHFRIGFICRLF